jgi:squalene-hopene/tetraprenyl-beta-curcumene cyclase
MTGESAGSTRAQPALDASIDAAIRWLDADQHGAGFWVGMLESNCCIEAEWLLAMHLLGVEDVERRAAIVRGILNRQRRDGAWEVYHDAPMGDINATVECYAALRACGLAPDAEPLRRARDWIFGHGGLARVRVFTRYWLALIGEWPWEHTPNIPPELIFLPRWFPFNIYRFASWARATMVPLSILSARRLTVPLPAECRLDELFPDGREAMNYLLPRGEALSWRSLFLAIDRGLHAYQKLGFVPGREKAIRVALDWVLEHQDADGAWGGIQPPWIYSLIALHREGTALDHPAMARGLGALREHWSYERGDGLHIQASESPVWDTALALLAMQDCGRTHEDSRAMNAAVEWLLDQQIFVRGDWKVRVRHAKPGGWAFERANVHYPDIDDTAVVLIVLARLRPNYCDRERLEHAISAGRDWMLAMQSSNGGWAAFDKDNDLALLTKLPFCDFGETLDPPSADVTAHVLEALGWLGVDRSHPAVARGLAYIRSEQEADGSWFGRWGVNYIYGTAAVLPALAALGEDMRQDWIRRAADWIVAHQNADGGWGETCASYMDDSMRGNGVTTASQTAWALMALLADKDERHRGAVERGVAALTATQRDGTWDEPQYTGTGFPGYGLGAHVMGVERSARAIQGTELARGFMINYNLYRHYFPLMALGRAREWLRGGTGRPHIGTQERPQLPSLRG